MNPLRSLHARVTINGTRTNLGYAPMATLMIRASQTYSASKSTGKQILMTLEVSSDQLPDSSVLDKSAQLEQSLTAQIMTDPDDESPFEGITIGRVQEAMDSEEYQRYNSFACNPDNRIGVHPDIITGAKLAYLSRFPDCVAHFPRWVT